MSFQSAIDGAQFAGAEAKSAHKTAHAALVAIGIHLRQDHGISRRKVAATLDVRESWVRDYCEG